MFTSSLACLRVSLWKSLMQMSLHLHGQCTLAENEKKMFTRSLDITNVMVKYNCKAVNERRWHHWPNTGRVLALRSDGRWWKTATPIYCWQINFPSQQFFIPAAFRKLYSCFNCSVRKTALAVNRHRGGAFRPGHRGSVAWASPLASPSLSAPSSSSWSDKWVWQCGFIKSQSSGGQQPDVTFKFPSCAAWGKDTWLWK